MACTEREDLASSPHPPCLLTVNISHSWHWQDLSDGFRQRQGTLLKEDCGGNSSSESLG